LRGYPVLAEMPGVDEVDTTSLSTSGSGRDFAEISASDAAAALPGTGLKWIATAD